MFCLFCKPFTSCVFPRNSFFLVPTNSSALSLSYPFQLTWNYLPNTLWHQGQVLPLQGNQPGPLHWAPLFETPASKMTMQQYSRSVSIKLKLISVTTEPKWLLPDLTNVLRAHWLSWHLQYSSHLDSPEGNHYIFHCNPTLEAQSFCNSLYTA